MDSKSKSGERIKLEVRRGRHYRAFKVLLRADRFHTAQGFADYWAIASKIAEDLGLSTEAGTGYEGHEIRNISFWDTPECDLFRAGFILRKRQGMADGFPAGPVEHTLKFRHPDIELVSEADMQANTTEKCTVKFKEEVLPAPDMPSGMRSVFSHNAVLKLPTVDLIGNVAELHELFPVTRTLVLPGETPVVRVNDLLIEEVGADLGVMSFDRFITNTDTSVWRHRGTGEPLVAEFSFQSRFKEELTSDKRAKGREKGEELHQALMRETGDWLFEGTTKTRTVYEHGGREIECHE